MTDELSVVEKETTELFLQELIFEMSDYFLCVVNDFTSLDQRYLDKLTRNLQNSNKPFREVRARRRAGAPAAPRSPSPSAPLSQTMQRGGARRGPGLHGR